MKLRFPIALVVAAATALVTCSEPLAPDLALQVSLPPSQIEVGDTVFVTATATAPDGSPAQLPSVTWSSSNPAVATVTQTGGIIGVGPGTATITVTGGAKSAARDVTVVAALTARVVINPAPARVKISETLTLTASALDRRDRIIPGRPVSWVSADETIAKVSPTGALTGVSIGSTLVTATSEGKTATTAVSVVAPVASITIGGAISGLNVGQTLNLTATPRDAAGAALTGREVVWTSSNAAIVGVASDGTLSAVAVGTAVVTATSEGISATQDFVVTVPVASVSTSAASLAIRVGEQRLLAATPLDAAGSPITGRSVTYSSSDPAVATVTAGGTVTAVAPGSANIVASAGSVSTTVAVSVSLVPVASVRVTPTTASKMVTETIELGAQPLDSAGRALSGRSVAWTTSSTGIAAVSATGVVTAVAPGAVTISASSEGKTGTAALTIRAIPVATVTLSRASLALSFGQVSPITASTLDSLGRTLSDRTIAWSSSNATIATVSSAGAVTAVGAGTATITATSEGKSASLTVSVTVPVSSIAVTPGSLAILRGESRPLAATALDSTGASLAGRAIGYLSGNPSIATVSPTGVVTGTNVGTTTISANSEGRVRDVPVTVAPVPVASVSLGASPVTMMNTQVKQFTAVALDSIGGVLTDRVVTWSTGSSLIATVTALGIVTAQEEVASTTLTATIEGKSATITINVIPIPVSSVDVVPSAPWMIQGNTLALVPTAKDSLNRRLIGRGFTYASSNPGVATVAADGTIRGLTVGQSTLTITCEGKSKSVTLTVVDALFPNEPGGTTAIVVRPFNTKALTNIDNAGAEGFWAGSELNPAEFIAVDSGAPISPPNVMRYRFPVGAGGSSSVSAGLIERGDIWRGAPPGGYKSIYVAAWIKFSPDFQGHATGDQKLFELFYGGSSSHVRVKAFFLPSAPITGLGASQTTYSLLNTTDPAKQRAQPPGVPGVGFVRGQWHRVEILSTLSTPGVANGILRWWIDGVPAGDINDLPMLEVGDSSLGWTAVVFAPVWGGGGDTVRATQFIDMDHIRVSVK